MEHKAEKNKLIFIVIKIQMLGPVCLCQPRYSRKYQQQLFDNDIKWGIWMSPVIRPAVKTERINETKVFLLFLYFTLYFWQAILRQRHFPKCKKSEIVQYIVDDQHGTTQSQNNLLLKSWPKKKKSLWNTLASFLFKHTSVQLGVRQ